MKESTAKDLILGGKTDYSVVVPAECDFYEGYAKDEFVRLFKEATGIVIPVVTDSGLSFSADKKIISIGRTSFFKASGVTAEFSELKRDGYKIVTKGNSLILIGGGTYGTVYAVYGFFERQFSYRYYMQDEWKIDKKQDDKLLDFDVTDIPDIENRTGRFYYPIHDPDCAIRMRTFSSFGTLRDGQKFFARYGEEADGHWDANHISEFLPLEVYQKDHPDWYNSTFTTLCLSNEEMWVEIVKQIKIRIAENKQYKYFLIGQEDNGDFCDCPKCQEQIKKYGKGGLNMRFTNYIAREIKKWLKETDPERVVYIGTFAYQATEEAPVVLDENGKYKPIDESVIPEDNVFVLTALVNQDWSLPMLDDTYNKAGKQAIDGWFALTDNIFLWVYCSNFIYAFGFFDSFHVLDDNYKICKDYKFKWVYFESNCGKQGTAFQPMLCFVHSQLAWNTSLKSADLIDEFMGAYYKEAKPYVKEYFESMKRYFRTKKAELDKKTGYRHGTYIWRNIEWDVYDKSFYDYSFVEKMFNLLTEGMNAIDKCDKYDEQTKTKLKERIMLERLTVRYITAEFFACEFYSMAHYTEYVNEFEKECEMLGIKLIKRRQTLKETFDKWRFFDVHREGCMSQKTRDARKIKGGV